MKQVKVVTVQLQNNKLEVIEYPKGARIIVIVNDNGHIETLQAPDDVMIKVIDLDHPQPNDDLLDILG